MHLLIGFLLRAILFAAGLVAALVFACLMVVLLAVWLLRAAWAGVTGRPVSPFVMRTGPRDAFEEMVRRARTQAGSRTPRADAAAGPRPRGTAVDVTDVEAK